MELTTALGLISTIASNKQQEVDALQLAVEMLSNRFVPELTRMQNAEAQLQLKTEAIEALEIEKGLLRNEISSITAELSASKSIEAPLDGEVLLTEPTN